MIVKWPQVGGSVTAVSLSLRVPVKPRNLLDDPQLAQQLRLVCARGPLFEPVPIRRASPVEIDAATDRRSGSSAPTLMGHLLCEAHERTTDSHVRRGDGRLPERLGDLGVRAAHLDARDDRLAVLGLQALQGGLVALQRLALRSPSLEW